VNIMNVGIYIYNQVEVLDFSGPFEVFTTASRVFAGSDPFSVFLVSETGTTVSARANFMINPHYSLHDHPPIDVLIIPGGVHTGEMTKRRILDWIADQANKANFVASVCTGVFLLAEAKVLTSQNVTTHWEDIPELRNAYPNLTVHESKRWIDEGSIITSAGISAGIDMSLHLVSRLVSLQLAEKTARQMEFDWTQN